MRFLSLVFVLLSTAARAQSLSVDPCLASGDFVKCTPLGGLFLNDGRGLFLGPDTNNNHFVQLLANPTMTTNYSLTMPATNGVDGQSLLLNAGSLGWFTPLTGSLFTTYQQELPVKLSAQAAATGNIDMGAGNPGAVDGVDCFFGCTLLLPNQTDNTQNGLWRVDLAGNWLRDSTMPDNTGSAWSAIVAVNDGGTVNGNTIWYSRSDGSGAVPFVQIPSYYKEDDSTTSSVVFKGNGTGATNSAAVLIRVTRIGREVFLRVPAVTSAATGTTSTHLDSQTNLAAFARPSATMHCYTGSYNNGALVANSQAEVDILSTGQIQVFRDITGSAYTNSANAGFSDFNCSYPIF